MVKEFYGVMGFEIISQNEDDTVWQLNVNRYKKSNDVIDVSFAFEDK